MKNFGSSQEEQGIDIEDDSIQFEDIDVPGMQNAKRWERYFQYLFTHKSRRNWLIGVILVCLIGLILVLAPLLPLQHNSSTLAIASPIHSYLEVATPWVVYEVQSEPGIIRALRRSDGAPVWSEQVLPSVNDSLTLALSIDSLTLAGNVLYTHIHKGRDSTLYALSASTGAILWIYKPPKPFTPFSFSVIVVDGIVYDSSLQGTVVALQSQTGKRLWSYQQNAIRDMQFHLSGNVIYLSFIQEKQTIALDALSGVMLWQRNRYLIFISANSGISYFSDQQSTLYAFQPRTGSVLWISPPAFLEKLIYVTTSGDLLIYAQSDGSVEAFHINTAHIAWRSRSPGFSISALVLANNHLYVVSSDVRHAILMSLDLYTGSLLWQYHSSAFPQVEGIGDQVYVKSTDDHIYVLRAETGKLLWHSSLGLSTDEVHATSGMATDPNFQVANDCLFITLSGQNANILTVLNDGNGHVLWRKTIVGTLLLSMGNAYVTGTDGSTYAYMGNSGKEIWSTQ